MCSTPRRCNGNLTVRRAKNGEKLLALDGKTYTLDDAMCVIADEKGVESLAGIMGGEASGCDGDDHRRADRVGAVGRRSTSPRPAASSASIPTRATASSAASIRTSCCRASSSRRRWCSSSAAATPSEIVVAGDADAPDKVIDFPLERSDAARRPRSCRWPRCAACSSKLGFFVAGQGERVKVAVPSWRPDIEGKADIVEEIVRIVGVDRVPSTPFPRGDARAQAGAHRRSRCAPARPSARSPRAA